MEAGIERARESVEERNKERERKILRKFRMGLEGNREIEKERGRE